MNKQDRYIQQLEEQLEKYEELFNQDYDRRIIIADNLNNVILKVKNAIEAMEKLLKPLGSEGIKEKIQEAMIPKVKGKLIESLECLNKMEKLMRSKELTVYDSRGNRID